METVVQTKSRVDRDMMENVHLAPEGDDDDIYSGYDYNDPLLEVMQL